MHFLYDYLIIVTKKKKSQIPICKIHFLRSDSQVFRGKLS